MTPTLVVSNALFYCRGELWARAPGGPEDRLSSQAAVQQVPDRHRLREVVTDGASSLTQVIFSAHSSLE